MLLLCIFFLPLSVVMPASVSVEESSECSQYRNCVDCTSTTSLTYHCQWKGNEHVGLCSKRSVLTASTDIFHFEDTCPVNYLPSSPFISNWMTELYPVIKDLTLLDLSLPGTHDTLTYDLSTTVSEGGMDDALLLAELLHNYTSIVPDGIEDFIRRQAQTHDLTITEQLDAGIRFIDFRMMLEYSDAELPWLSLHMVQSQQLALEYFTEIREWMDSRPGEVVVLFVSKHGSACKTGEDQYPNVTISQKQEMWSNMLSIFEGLVVDFSMTKLNETDIGTMLDRNHRVVFYMADYAEMTGSSRYALDQCNDVDNGSQNPGVFDLDAAIPWQQNMYAAAMERKEDDFKDQKFYKVSLATGGSTTQIVSAAILQFVQSSDKHDLEQVIQQCAADFNIPGLTWCPPTLLDIAQLESFYSQIAMNQAVENESWSFPNGLVLNGLDRDGTIRTGTQVLWGGIRNAADEEHWQTAFGYVDAFIAINLRRACLNVGSNSASVDVCQRLTAKVKARQALHPYTRWDDVALGRSSVWPVK